MNISGSMRFCGVFSVVIAELGYFRESFLCILGSYLKVKTQLAGWVGGGWWGGLTFGYACHS